MSLEHVNDVLNATWDPYDVVHNGHGILDAYMEYSIAIDSILKLRSDLTDSVVRDIIVNYLVGVETRKMRLYSQRVNDRRFIGIAHEVMNEPTIFI